MRRGYKNYITVRVVDMDLTTCTNLILMVKQNGVTYTYNGTVDSSDHEVMKVEIPKADAVKFEHLLAEVQIALTDADGVPRSHDPIKTVIGDFLEVNGYGE